VEKKVRVFSSFEEADESDAREDALLSSQQRLDILIQLRDQRHHPDAAEQGLARVSRVVELERIGWRGHVATSRVLAGPCE
jgi:hypothetical protein